MSDHRPVFGQYEIDLNIELNKVNFHFIIVTHLNFQQKGREISSSEKECSLPNILSFFTSFIHLIKEVASHN